MSATAGPANAVPDGRRYDLLVFARGENETQSDTAAAAGLDLLGWIDREVLRVGEITDPAAVPEDLAPAMRRAAEEGCAVIVYEQP